MLICCDSARAVVATASLMERAAGAGDDPKTMADLRAHVAKTIAYLQDSWTPISASMRAVTTIPTGPVAGDGRPQLRSRVRHPELLLPPHHDLCPAAPGRGWIWASRDYLGGLNLQ